MKEVEFFLLVATGVSKSLRVFSGGFISLQVQSCFAQFHFVYLGFFFVFLSVYLMCVSDLSLSC